MSNKDKLQYAIELMGLVARAVAFVIVSATAYWLLIFISKGA